MSMPHRFEATGNFQERLEGPERTAAIPAAKIVASMSLRPNDVVIDLGAGTGYFSLPMALAAGTIVAVDIEADMVRFLDHRLHDSGVGNVRVVQGDVLLPPVASGAASHILAAFIYHEVDSPKKLVEECARMLRPGGKLTIIDFQKRETGFGPPVSERKSPEQVLRTTNKYFDLDSRLEAEAYYQLVLSKR